MLRRDNGRSVVFVVMIFAVTMLLSGSALAQEELDLSQNFVADIADEVEQGVVMIDTVEEVERESPFAEEDIFRYFFPDMEDEFEEREPDDPYTREGIGSGFIATEDGHIVTNEHVVADADTVMVTIRDFEEQKEAELIWADQSLDLAVLQVDTDEELEPLPMGDSDDIRQGDWAIAIGNPVGLDYTVTLGVISALERPIDVPTREGQIRRYSNLIQTDAAINPGNSGGPLVNIEGEVIGINTAVATQAQGIGFAIPINEVKFALEDIQEYGEVRTPWLGVYYRGVTEEIQSYFDLEDDTGIIITDVMEGSPADEAGLQPYDVVRELEQERIETVDDFAGAIREKEVGEEIMLNIIRDGSPELIIAELGQVPDQIQDQ